MLICLTNVHARYWRGCPRQTPYLVAFFANLSQADKHDAIYAVSVNGNLKDGNKNMAGNQFQKQFQRTAPYSIGF